MDGDAFGLGGQFLSPIKVLLVPLEVAPTCCVKVVGNWRVNLGLTSKGLQ